MTSETTTQPSTLIALYKSIEGVVKFIGFCVAILSFLSLVKKNVPSLKLLDIFSYLVSSYRENVQLAFDYALTSMGIRWQISGTVKDIIILWLLVAAAGLRSNFRYLARLPDGYTPSRLDNFIFGSIIVLYVLLLWPEMVCRYIGERKGWIVPRPDDPTDPVKERKQMHSWLREIGIVIGGVAIVVFTSLIVK